MLVYELSLRSKLVLQKRVIFALIMREIRTRFGEYQLGYAWVILEPLAHVAVYSVMFMSIRQRDFHGVSVPIFVIMGVIPWLLFRKGMGESMDAIRANRGLFNHRQVRPFDAIFTRVLLEGIIYTTVFFILIGCAYWFGFENFEVDLLPILGLFFLLMCCAFNMGMFTCVMASLYKESRKFIKVGLKPLYFISGIFFTIEMIPEEGRAFLLWNPILHASDLLKGIMIPRYESPASWEYLIAINLVFMPFVIMLYRINIERLLRQ